MYIFPEISKNGWKSLISLAAGSATASEIVKKTKMRKNRVSEALHELQKYRIITLQKRKKPISIDAPLKKILQPLLTKYPNERIAELFAAKGLNILFQVFDGYDTSEKLKLVTGYSAATLKRNLKFLQNNLLIYQPIKGRYRIRSEFQKNVSQLRSLFLAYFLERLGAEWSEVKVFGNRILMKSIQKTISDFVLTGFSVFHKYKVEIIGTSSNYFVNQKRKPKKQEVFLHALVFSMNDYRNLILCMVFAQVNKLRLEDMKNLLKIFKVEGEVESIFEFLKSKGKIKAEFLPTYQEYLSVRRLYG